MRTDLYPSEAALCRLVRIDRTPPAPVSSQEWQAVLWLAIREQVAPLVYSALDTLPDGQVPDAVRTVLALSYQHAAAETAEAYAQLAGVLRTLRSAGLSAVALKGSALARFTYQDAAFRPFTDLDLLVRLENVDAAHKALCGAGYAIVGDAPTAEDLTWRHGRGYYDPTRRRIPVDVHWRYAGYPLLAGIDYGDVFGRARAVPVEDEQALIPSPPDMLVALGVHFQRDLWYGKPRLRYLRDIAEVAHRHVVDWQHLLRVARDVPLVRSPLYLALAAAAELLGASIPADTLRALRPPGRGALARYLQARVCRNVLRQERPIDAVFQIVLMRWLDADSVAGYLRWISALIFVPRGLAASRRRWLGHLWERRPSGDSPDG